MAFSGENKAFCVLEFAKCESIVTVRRRFRTKYKIDPPTDKTIHAWYTKFLQNGCVCAGKSTGRPGPSDETVQLIRETFAKSPQKSTQCASRELKMPQSTVWRILRNHLHVKPFGELTEELDGETVEENVELDSSKRMKLGKSSTIGKRKRKAMVQDKPASSTKVSQKDSETVDFATVASTNPMEIEVAAENPESDPGGGWKQTFQKPSDFLESTMILQDGEVITIKEENCSIASREGSEERVIGPEPPSPPILDAGELSESGEEWLPT